MSKLFAATESPKLHLSAEEFVEYYSTSSVVSQEAISDYFHALKDSIANTVTRLFDGNVEKAMLDATSNKFEVLNVAKRVHIAHLSDEYVTVPEGFQGLYTDYLKHLTKTSEDMFADTVQLLNNLKMAVAGFVNEHKDGNVLSVYGVSYAKLSEAKCKKHRESTSKFFSSKKGTSKTQATNVIRSLGDVETIYRGLPELSAVVSSAKVAEIQKLAVEVSEMIDVLIEQNTQSAVLTNNSSAKREFINMVHVGAKGVEFCGYLYANTIYFYNGVKSLTDTIIVVGNR